MPPCIPSLTIQLTNARADDVAVALDNTQLPSALLGEARPTDPGQHFVVATRGTERQQVEVQLREGEQRELKIQFRAQAVASGEPVGGGDSLTLTPLAAAGPAPSTVAAPSGATSASPLKPLGVITMAFGGATLATAAVTALIAHDKRGECVENVCQPEVKQSYDAFRTVSMFAFYAGAGLAVGGLVMWLAAPGDDEAPTASLRIDPPPSASPVPSDRASNRKARRSARAPCPPSCAGHRPAVLSSATLRAPTSCRCP